MSAIPLRQADAQVSNNQKEFILKVGTGNMSHMDLFGDAHELLCPQALLEDVRIDGRRPLDYRKASFQYTLDDSSCTVLLGQTRVLSVVSAELEAPWPDRQVFVLNHILQAILDCTAHLLRILMHLPAHSMTPHQST